MREGSREQLWPRGFLQVRRRPTSSCFMDRRAFHDGPLTEREKRQGRNAVVQMLEADVFKTVIGMVSEIR